MNRIVSALRWMLAIAGLAALSAPRVAAAPTISNVACSAVSMPDGSKGGTEKTWFVFTATVKPSDNQFIIAPLALPGTYFDPGTDASNSTGLKPPPNVPYVFIRLSDPGTPTNGCWYPLAMRHDVRSGAGPYDYIAIARGLYICEGKINSNGVGSPEHSTWAIVSNETASSGSAQAASAVSNYSVFPSYADVNANDYAFSLTSLTPDGADDTAGQQGQQGNGLRTYPTDSTAPNDGTGAHEFVWRVRFKSLSGLPPSLFNTNYDGWEYAFRGQGGIPEARFRTSQSGVLLALTGPGQNGAVRYLPMEIEPGQGVTADSTYSAPPGTEALANVTGSAAFANGVNYRYVVMPTEYYLTAFGGDMQESPAKFTSPDGLMTEALGSTNTAVTGRPFANTYAGFGDLDALLLFAPFPPPAMPYYTQAQGRPGSYRYYYTSSVDFRPDPTPWDGSSSNNFAIGGWIVNQISNVGHCSDYTFSKTPGRYWQMSRTDDPNGYGGSIIRRGFPGFTSWAYQFPHPVIGPIVTDGNWTDDLAENKGLQVSVSYAGDPTVPYDATGSVASNARRSRATTKTRVRYQCRVFDVPPNGTSTPITVRIWLGTGVDGSMVAYPMAVEPTQTTLDYTQGVIYYYDRTYAAGQEGLKVYYIEAFNGKRTAIWPRRPVAGDDPWGRYEDGQASGLPNRSEASVFGGGTVGKNYVTGPYVNHRAVLSNPAVSPISGTEQNSYTYSVTYTDVDGDLPIDAWVIVDKDPVNRRYRMTRDTATAGNTPAQGIRYQFTLTSLPGSLNQKHQYQFQFRDNWAANQPIRREYGEWVTLPQGDDHGNPSSWIDGPIIVGNRLPSLTNPSISSSDQSNNTATSHDFFVTYSDPDNDPPAYIKAYVDVYETATNNLVSAVPDAGTAMVRVSGGATNYVVGEQYHLPAMVRLPATISGQEYRVRFQASDGKGPVNGVGPDITEITVGGDGSNPDLCRVLTRTGDTPPTYIDANGTRMWNANVSTLSVWLGTGAATVAAPAGSFAVDALQRKLVFAQNQDPGANTVVRLGYRYTQLVGPIVGRDNAPVLAPIPGGNAGNNFLTCTPLQGSPTTPFKFTIVYSDADDQAPVMTDTNGNPITAVRLVINGAGSYPLFIDPTDATPTPIDYRVGKRFTGTVTLGVGNYSYHFEASDGAMVARYPIQAPDGNPPYELPGPTVEDIGSLTSPKITPYPKGLSNQLYQFEVTYVNASGVAPPGPIELRIWDTTGQTVTKLAMNLASNPPDYRAGAIYRNATILNGVQTATAEQPLSWGAHRVNFGFQDRAASTADMVLTVNAPPSLSDPTPTAFVTPNPAARSATVRFSVKYSDLNGDPPVDPTTKASRIKLYVADSTGTYVQVTGATLTPDPSTFAEYPAATSDAIKSGLVFTWAIAESNLPDATVAGTRNIKFTATDDFGENATDLTVPNGLTIAQAGLPYLQGPTIGQGANDGTLTPAIGTKAMQYTYSVVYRNDLNVAPDTLTLVLQEGATTVKTVNLADFTRSGSDYVAGVTYTYTTQANLFNSGNHTYAFTATQGSNTVTLPSTGQYAGPYVNFPPVLQTLQVVVVSNGVAGAPSTADPATGLLSPVPSGSLLDKYIVSVTYKDVDEATTPPSYVKIVGTTTDLDGVILTPPSSGTLDYTAGVVYSSSALTLTPGAKQFHIQAADRSAVAPAGVELDTVRLPASVEVTNLTVANLIQLYGPDLSDLVRQGTLSPISGAVSGNYTFRVVYKHVAGTAPTTMNAIIWDQTGTVVVATAAMSAVSPSNPTTAQYKAGVTFGVTVPGSQIGGGLHKYSFFASDGTTTEQLPSGSGRFDGPTLNNPPTLDTPTVYVYDAANPGGPSNPAVWDPANGLVPAVSGSVQSQYVFRVNYTDLDKVGPTASGYVRAVVTDQGLTVPMHVKTAPADYTGAVVYESAPVTLTAGTKTFHFEASDGIDPTQTVDIKGLTVRSTLVLSAPSSGTVSPASGPVSTDFTYQVMYQNADGTPPASVKLIIDGDAANAKTMTKVGTSTDYVTGVIYTYTYRFAKTVTTRNHTYRFTAVDTATSDFTGYYPGPSSTDTLAGPLINTATFTTTPSPLGPGVVGNQYTIVGQLVTAPALAPSDNRAVRVQLVRPDGSGINEDITVGSDGSFNYTTTATLDQTGDWVARFIWDGVAGKFDSVTMDFPFKVKLTSIQFNLTAGNLAMISSPLVPTNSDPNSIYNPLDSDGNPIAEGVTVLDMQAWSGSAYISYNRDANFPVITAGRGIWVRPTQAVTLSPQGKVWDKTQPYSISLDTGWSIIGPVSLQTLAWSGVKVRYQGVEMNPSASNSPLRNYAWTYDRAATGNYKPYKLIQSGDVLTPGQGYWVRATAPCEIVLPASTRAATVTRSATDIRTTALQVTARTKTSIDTDNFVVLDSGARSRMVPIEKPPYLGDYVSVQMLPANAIKTSDVGRASTADDLVGFEITSNQKNTDVTVNFPNVASLGRRYSFIAVDLASGTRRSLNTAGTLTYNTGDCTAPRRFALIIGHATQNGRLVISNVRSAGRATGGVSLSYSLSGDATIQIDVLNSTGETVRNLNQGRAATAGANSVLWDGRNGNGTSLPAGQYVLRLKASDAQGNIATYSHPVVLIR